MSRKKNTTIRVLIRVQTGLEQDAYLEAALKSGKTGAQIARELGVSKTQINNLLRPIRAKLNSTGS